MNVTGKNGSRKHGCLVSFVPFIPLTRSPTTFLENILYIYYIRREQYNMPLKFMLSGKFKKEYLGVVSKLI